MKAAVILIYIANPGSGHHEASPMGLLITAVVLTIAAGVVFWMYLSWKKEQKRKKT